MAGRALVDRLVGEEERIEPGGLCQACGRRAAIHVLGGPGPDGEHFDDFLETHPVYLCGWCPIPGPIKSQDDLERALVAARSASVSWRWRWPVTDALPQPRPLCHAGQGRKGQRGGWVLGRAAGLRWGFVSEGVPLVRVASTGVSVGSFKSLVGAKSPIRAMTPSWGQHHIATDPLTPASSG